MQGIHHPGDNHGSRPRMIVLGAKKWLSGQNGTWTFTGTQKKKKDLDAIDKLDHQSLILIEFEKHSKY